MLRKCEIHRLSPAESFSAGSRFDWSVLCTLPLGGVASTRGKQMPVLTFQEQSFELLEAGLCRASAISL